MVYDGPRRFQGFAYRVNGTLESRWITRSGNRSKRARRCFGSSERTRTSD